MGSHNPALDPLIFIPPSLLLDFPQPLNPNPSLLWVRERERAGDGGDWWRPLRRWLEVAGNMTVATEASHKTRVPALPAEFDTEGWWSWRWRRQRWPVTVVRLEMGVADGEGRMDTGSSNNRGARRSRIGQWPAFSPKP